jgi:D-3-phosphoglycerate dehydrogenase
MKPELLVATEISNISGLIKKLDNYFFLNHQPEISEDEIPKISKNIIGIFTNPNNSKIYYGEDTLKNFPHLKFIATASTGTIHIDKNYTELKGIELISITNSISVLEKITSTAELAFLLTLSAIRNYDGSVKSVNNNLWDYSRFIGRQLNSLTVGILGLGRLGKMYANYCKAFGANILCCDPYIKDQHILLENKFVSISELFERSDIVSLHIHATPENIKIIDDSLLNKIKEEFILVNTARGEIVDEKAILKKLDENKGFKYFTDVISGEHLGVKNNILRLSRHYGERIIITPHCGGMTKDARVIAYSHAADLLINKFKKFQ